MDDRRSPFPRFHHPLETNRMVLGHVRSHDQDRIRVCQVLLSCRRAAATERCAQTGHRGAMSYTGLVADAVHPQASSEQLLNKVVLFVVESRSAKMRDP